MRKINVQELSIEDQKNINGGLGPIGVAILAGAAWSIFENWGDIRDGWNDGMAGNGPRY